MRALDVKCASTSAASKNTVAQLCEQPLARKVGYLCSAVLLCLPNIVRCALEAKISANTRSPDALKQPVLVTAAFKGSAPILKLLLDAGADHGLTDSNGFTALLLAAQEGQLECAQLLLAARADAKKSGPLGLSPLMASIIRRWSECARALLPASNVLATNNQGHSALHVCALNGNEECFELLLPLMSDVDIDVRTTPGVDEYGRFQSSTCQRYTSHARRDNTRCAGRC